MKKLIVVLAALMLAALCVCAAGAEPSYSDDLPEYFVCTEHKARGEYILYMYSVPSDGGNAIAHYHNGEVVKMIEKDVKGLNTFSYVVGPDGAVGYVQTRRIVETGVKDSIHYAHYSKYVVIPGSSSHVYSYGEPDTKHDAVKKYEYGTVVKMVNWDADKKYAFIMDEDYEVGYIEKSKLITWDEWISGYTPTPVPTATPTPRVTATPTPQPWYTPTPTPRPWYTPTPTPRPWYTPTPTPRPWYIPTATPTPRPTATPTPTPRTFWNSTGYELLLAKYNSTTGTYTTIDSTVAYMSQLAAGESYRIRLHVTNTTAYGVQYTLTANLNGTSYNWNPYTIGAHKSVYHNLGAVLSAGSNSVIMYVDGTILCSARYTIVDDTQKTTPTPTPWSYVTPTPTPYNWNTDPWGQTGNVNNSLTGHWLRVDESTADDIILLTDGSAIWNGQACTWTQRYGTFTVKTYWGTQTYTYQVNGDIMYLSNTGMGLNRAEYHWITMDYNIAGNWTQAGNAGIITFGADNVLTMDNVNYSWATAGNYMFLTSLWDSERYQYVVSGNTMILYNYEDPAKIEKVLIRVK